MPRKKAETPSRARATPHGRLLLRIIGGAWRGRKIHFPPVEAIRPTPDRVRETVFNWLQLDVAGSRCLDLFAGSGALGLEALSRGAARVVFVEVDPAVTRHLSQTLRDLQCDRGVVVRSDARQYLAGAVEPFDIVFLDPPYAAHALADTCRAIEERGWLRPGGVAYLEDAASAGPPDLPSGWTLLRSKRAGEVGYHLARRERPTAA
ncbi:MAG: 16S rRNA (guanine(966)-N(2))-methyltransferase RsmD [Gammaproteobacteria bacterium]|nr:16S rRNA (guanine(966)-N(2))-methyltransferase RsmD [Gammaproteobacteria bacterium]